MQKALNWDKRGRTAVGVVGEFLDFFLELIDVRKPGNCSRKSSIFVFKMFHFSM